jgi:hypothetical protein
LRSQVSISSQLLVPVLEQPCPDSRIVGYARVSTDDQDLSLRIDPLQQHGIPKAAIFIDKESGAKTERPGLTRCLESHTSGDKGVLAFVSRWRSSQMMAAEPCPRTAMAYAIVTLC